MLHYRCDDQGGPQPPPNWNEPKPAPQPEKPEGDQGDEKDKPAAA